MRLRAEATDPASVEANVLAVPIYKEDDPFGDDLANLDAAASGTIRRAIEWGRFNILEDYSALIEGGDLPVDHILLVNGVRRGRGPWRARRIAAVATRALRGTGASRMALWLRDGEEADAFEAAAVGALSGAYRPMDLYGRERDTEAMRRTVEEVVVLGADQAVLDRAITVADGVAWCRDLSNRAANDLYPEKMAEEARALEAEGCTVEVLHVPEMRQLGMNALLGVGQGGEHPPCLIAVKLPGWAAGGDRRLAMVGKGVCFDSGGLSLKPADKMDEMKHDKSGAAAVLAAARTLARLAPDAPVMAVAPMVENMPGGRAQRPGDVVKAMNGKTIEVTNTDAEGRLILADALAWAEIQGATHLVDVATLTGVAANAFGELITAYFSRPRAWGERIRAAADATGEWLWEMPLAVEYRPQLDTPYADLVNSGTRDGSLIKSALFLAEFATKPWAHLDVAGTAWMPADKATAPKGAVGVAVTTLVRLGLDFATAPAGD